MGGHMPTTSINITRELNEWITHKVESGDYNNASELFREGLRILKARDEREHLELELLRHKIGTGIEQADNKNFSTRSIRQIIAETKDKLNG